MSLLAVKLFDLNNNEISSTISLSPSSELNYFDKIQLLHQLVQNDSTIQGFIYKNHLITCTRTFNDLLLVAVATSNTSPSKLNQFLNVLNDSLSRSEFRDQTDFPSENFQNLCDSILTNLEATPQLKISLLGLERSGKTSFINYFDDNRPLGGFESYEPTNLLNISDIDHISDLPYKFRFYDLGMAYRRHWYKFSQESDGYIFFVDTSDPKQISKSRELLQDIRNFWDLPYVIAANKRDSSKIVNIRKYLSRKLKVPIRIIYEVETLTGFGIISLLEGLVENEIRAPNIPVTLK